MNTQQETIALHTKSGPLLLEATVCAGLALHPYVLHTNALSPEYYTVTHIASGSQLFDTPIKGVRKATRYFQALIKLADWHLPVTVLVQDKTLAERIKVLQKEMGI